MTPSFPSHFRPQAGSSAHARVRKLHAFKGRLTRAALFDMYVEAKQGGSDHGSYNEWLDSYRKGLRI